MRIGMDKGARRQQLLTSARDVFAKRGYHAAKIEDIVSAAGVARGTFYLYFEDKRAILEEIIDRVLARIGMTILRVDPHDRARTVEDQILENVRRIVGMLVLDPATTKILLSDAMGVDPAFDRKLQAFNDELGNLLDESLRDGQKLGIVAPGDTRLYAVLIVGALREMLVHVVRGDAAPDVDALVDGFYGFLTGGCLRVSAPARPPSARC
ncbi:MAG: TetR/AcrR family transcriptional regulator [Polyangiaceae bacterium]